MPHQTFKYLTACTFLITLAFGSFVATKTTYGAVNRDYERACEELESTSWNKAPSPMAIICPIARLMNVFIYSAAAFFVAFIFIAAIKYALSQGDPKALQASQQTLTMALLGFLIIIGAWTILTIVKNIFGLEDSILDPFATLVENLAQLLERFRISTP